MKWKDEDYPEGLTQADFAEGLIRQKPNHEAYGAP